MNCLEFQEYISAAVDSYLSAEEMRLFEAHADTCPACRSAYAQESSTKRLLRARTRMVLTPPSVAAAILDRLREEGGPPSPAPGWRRVVRAPLFRPAVGFALAFALVVVLVSDRAGDRLPGSRLTAAGTNLLLQSVQNYRAVIRGDIRPQIASAVPGQVQDFFLGKTTFPVRVPAVKDWTLVGGVLKDHEGLPVVHVVYRQADQTVYLFQTCWKTVNTGTPLQLPAAVMGDLQNTGWHTEQTADGDAIVLWTSDGTLCAAVGHMPSTDLLATLAPFATQPRP